MDEWFLLRQMCQLAHTRCIATVWLVDKRVGLPIDNKTGSWQSNAVCMALPDVQGFQQPHALVDAYVCRRYADLLFLHLNTCVCTG